jgi:hypothetical protein
MPSPKLVYYYDYVNSYNVQEGEFGTDMIVLSNRYILLYSDANLTKQVGYLFTQGEYTDITLSNTDADMIYDYTGTINLNNKKFMKISAMTKYLTNTPGKPPATAVYQTLVTASNMGHIGSSFDIEPFGNVYRLEIL